MLLKLTALLVVLTMATYQLVVAFQFKPPKLQQRFLIPPKSFDSIPKAVAHLRRFIQKDPPKELQCQRLALVLLEAKRTDFGIAEIALSNTKELNSKLRTRNLDRLKDLFTKAISSYLDQKLIDSGLVELISCLYDYFKASGNNASRFYQDNELKKIVEQYKAIAEQPLNVIVDPDNHKIQDLGLEGVGEGVKKFLMKLVGEAKFEYLFTKNELTFEKIEHVLKGISVLRGKMPGSTPIGTLCVSYFFFIKVSSRNNLDKEREDELIKKIINEISGLEGASYSFSELLVDESPVPWYAFFDAMLDKEPQHKTYNPVLNELYICDEKLNNGE